MDKINYTYELDFSVRDYELDLQGIVNNAVYQNYLEHTRHEFLKSKGLDFNQLHLDGYDAVVVRSEIDYKKSLTSGDSFTVKIGAEREGRLKMVFHQQILRHSDQAIILNAKIFAACIHNNRPIEPLLILEKMGLLS
jgi:acyl-CoA thioester hydrolase